MSYLSFIRLLKDADDVDYFYYRIRYDGMNFPSNGPVLQKETVKWEPSTEKLYVRDRVVLTWLCCLKEVAITGVSSKLLTSEFSVS